MWLLLRRRFLGRLRHLWRFTWMFMSIWQTRKKKKSNEAIYTFVAVDQNGSPIEVPELIAETDLGEERYAGALRRRQLSLILSGKMKPEAATELRALFG